MEAREEWRLTVDGGGQGDLYWIKVYFSDSSLHDTVGTGQARTGINTG